MSSNVEAAYFTTDNSNSVVCQRCLQSFEEGTELYFMHDRKPDGKGKRVCGGCRQYYLRKTETYQRAPSSSQSMHALLPNKSMVLGHHASASASVQITLVAQSVVSHQNIHKAVADAQKCGMNLSYAENIGNKP